MVFYRVEVELENAENTEVSVRSETEAYFQRRQYAFHITFSSIRQRGSESAVLCAAVRNERLTEQMIKDYLHYMGFAYKSMRYHEITAKDYGDLLDTAERNDFIYDSENITDKLDFPSFSQNRRRSGLEHSEALVSDRGDRETLDNRFAYSLCADCFFDEFDRIEKTAPTGRAIGHPVHYLIQSRNKGMRRELTEALISSLYRKYRLQSQRCVTVIRNALTLGNESAQHMIVTFVCALLGRDRHAGERAGVRERDGDAPVRQGICPRRDGAGPAEAGGAGERGYPEDVGNIPEIKA